MLQVLVAISQSFVAEKRHGVCKSYLKKERKEKKKLRKKWTSVRDILNNRYSDARIKKEKMNKIAPIL